MSNWLREKLSNLALDSQADKIALLEQEVKSKQAVIDELVRLVRIWRERTWYLEDKYEPAPKKDDGRNS